LALNPVWIVFGIAVLASGVVTGLWFRGRGDEPDLGFVSHQWLTEHRLSQPQDSDR
jgi:hypothetical protein